MAQKSRSWRLPTLPTKMRIRWASTSRATESRSDLHCATFAPVLNQVQQKYGAKVAILAVANTPHENANTVGQYVKSHGITYPVLFDSGQMEYSYVRKMS